MNGVPLPTPNVNHSALVPALFRPDCDSVLRGGQARAAASTAWEACSGDGRVGSGTGLLEMWMTDQPGGMWG